MRTTTLGHLACSLLFLFLASGAALAENQQDFGDYVVYYNAFTTDVLPPDVARKYDIQRSKNRGMLNLSVQKKVMGTAGEPVAAQVLGHARNLNGQIKTLSLRTLRDGNAVYHIAVFPVSHAETLDFELTVRPNGTDQTLNVRFRKQFFTR